MANLVCWNFTELPSEVIDILERDIKKFDYSLKQSEVIGSDVDLQIRNSGNTWISTSNWIGGWLWYYVSKMNRENFLYDIVDIDNGSLQYTHYSEGQYYNWHSDSDLDMHHKPTIGFSSFDNRAQEKILQEGEYIRKLSFTLQLS